MWVWSVLLAHFAVGQWAFVGFCATIWRPERYRMPQGWAELQLEGTIM